MNLKKRAMNKNPKKESKEEMLMKKRPTGK